MPRIIRSLIKSILFLSEIYDQILMSPNTIELLWKYDKVLPSFYSSWKRCAGLHSQNNWPHWRGLCNKFGGKNHSFDVRFFGNFMTKTLFVRSASILLWATDRMTTPRRDSIESRNSEIKSCISLMECESDKRWRCHGREHKNACTW